MKSFSLSAAAGSLAATLLLLGNAVAPVAAQATNTTANTTAIPTDISASCQTFLTTLNTDPTLDACTKPLLAATKYYSSSNSSDSSTQLDSTLSDLCSNNTGCDPNVIRNRLDQFWQSCSTDLQSKKAEVQAMYDNLYMITPLVNSICSKDTNNQYCLKTITKAAATSQRNTTTTTKARRDVLIEDLEAIAALEKRQAAASNVTAISSTANTNAAFLFLSSSSPKSILCSRCTQLILASYIKFETSIPYAIGLRISQTLAPQSDIYKTVKTDCGIDFVAEVNKIANTTQFAAVVSSAPGSGAQKSFAALATLIASAVVAFVAL